MKFPQLIMALLLLLLPSLASELPTCALDCLIAVAPQLPCGLTNQTCMCTNLEFQQLVTPCVLSNCTVKEALVTRNITATRCNEPIRDRSRPYNDVSLILGVISGAFVVVRLGYKTIVATMELGSDDWWILVTIIAGVPNTVLVAHGSTANGLGKDIWTLPFDMITDFSRYFYVMEILYFTQLALLKTSLLVFYLRIFPTPNVRRLLWGVMIFNGLFGLVFVVLAIFQCSPVSYFWTKWDGEHAGTCLNTNGIGWANASISIAIDVCMLAIPLAQIRCMNLHWKKKIGAGLMFGIGTFVTIVSIIRLKSLVTFANSVNPTWDNWDVSNWSTIELNVGIMCACLPSIRLIIVRMLPSLGGSVAGRYRCDVESKCSNVLSRKVTRGEAPAASGPSQQSPARGIIYQKSYSIHYDDSDESALVYMRDIDSKQTSTGTNSSMV